MGAFNTKVSLDGNPSCINKIADEIENHFVLQGYQTKKDNLLSGGIELFVSRGGMFKEVLGMRTALKITLIPTNNHIMFEAGIGIFGQQFVPTIISMLFAWPVLITQIWGLIKQAQLDDKALEIAKTVIASEQQNYTLPNSCEYCTQCGAKISKSINFCPICGKQIK